ncbi:hypothetical protein ACTPEF_26330, partial [Clostridioides difficile]
KSQKYKAVTEVSAMSRDGHILCGDNYTYMEINDGKYMMAISDEKNIVEEIKRLTDGDGADIVIESAGTPLTCGQVLLLAKKGGT